MGMGGWNPCITGAPHLQPHCHLPHLLSLTVLSLHWNCTICLHLPMLSLYAIFLHLLTQSLCLPMPSPLHMLSLCTSLCHLCASLHCLSAPSPYTVSLHHLSAPPYAVSLPFSLSLH